VGLEVEWSSLAEIFAEFGMPPQLPEKAWGGAVPLAAAGSDRQIGRATSGTWSPLLKRYLALGRVEPAYAKPGTRLALEVTAEGYRRPAKAVVAELPFFDPPRKRG
jgi:aminomethyltransferase